MAKFDVFVARSPALSQGAPVLAFHQLASLTRVIDALAIAVPAILIYLAYGLPTHLDYFLQYLVSIAVAVIVALICLQRFGTYEEGQFFDPRSQFRRIIGALGLTAAILLATVAALKITDFYSRVWATLWFVTSIGMVPLLRSLFRAWAGRLADAGRFALRTVIIGTGERSTDLARYFDRNCRRSIRVVDVVDDRTKGAALLDSNDRDDAGLSSLLSMIRRGLVDQVVVAIPWQERDRINGVLNALAVTPVDIRLAPDLLPRELRSRHYVDVAGLPMLGVFDCPISGWNRLLKTAEDRALSALFLVLLSPLLALITIAIRLETPGPVLFRQVRFGFNNQEIGVLKYRTMYVEQSDQPGDVQAKREDPRVTRIGRLLRKWSLDELPQLLNVLRGEMSIVGPRPHPLALKAAGRSFEDVVEQYAARHKVKPGITGWAQVNGWRGETDTIEKAKKRVEFDLDYIENWSIWFDLYIIARTVVVLFQNRDTY